MAKPNARSVRAKQNAVLRYIASTDINTTADDFGIAPSTLRKFVQADPKKVAADPKGFQKLIQSKPEQIARKEDVHLVRKYTGKRRSNIYHHPPGSLEESQIRGLQYSKATQERRFSGGHYVPVEDFDYQRRVHTELIIEDLSKYNQATLDEMRARGDITQDDYDEVVASWKRIYGKRK